MNVKVMPGGVVCTEAEYVGDITIGSRTVVHPKARITAEAGPIILGSNNLIEEQAEILNMWGDGEDKSTPKTLCIGNNNVFEVGSVCLATKIGDNNVLEAKSYVGMEIELTNGCVVGPKCALRCSEVVPPNTVIQGESYSRRIQSDRPSPQGLQLDFLTKILPNYHHLIKPKRKIW